MQKSENIVSYTKHELDEMVRRGEDQTNWEYLDALTEEELEASIDHQEEGEVDLGAIYVGYPEMQRRVPVFIDDEVVAWFKAAGDGYRSRMNDVLRSHVETQQARTSSNHGSAGSDGEKLTAARGTAEHG